MKKVAVFDLDGTIADIQHRLWMIHQMNKDWDGFYKACVNDKPIPGVIEWMRYMSKTHTVVILSGRSDVAYQSTFEWLKDNNVPYHYLFMRSEGDHRKDTGIKAEMMEHHVQPLGEVDFIVEDRPSMIDMWRENGFTVYPVTGDSWD